MRVGIETAIISLLTLAGATTPIVPGGSYSLSSPSNPLGINYEPAPSPEEGPPLSAHALRNPVYLPAEIGGIAGAYVLVVSTALLALWTIGRRLRREKRLSRGPVDVEMLAASNLLYPANIPANLYPSPITPISSQTAAKNFSWPSPEKTDRNPYIFPAQNAPISPVGSDPSVDFRVVEADREQLSKGLEDIYAHVMAQEEAKAAGLELPPPPMPVYRQSQPREPVPAAAPQRLSKKSDRSRPSTLDVTKEKSHSRASSFIASLKSPRKKPAKELQISSPMPTPLSNTFPVNYASDEEPLSPRHYHVPPPPPVPTDQVPYMGHSRNSSTDPSPVSPTRSIAEQLQNSNPLPFQHRLNPSTSTIGHGSINSSRIDIRQPAAPISIQSAQARNPLPAIKTQNSANNSTRTLPFRAFDPPPGLSSPSFSHTTKTTVLERTTPLSPGLRTPWTAGAVPYSPYQPQTPLIPVTPRLVTKEDRKMMKRVEKRAPAMELVKSEDELWDSGY
jgi:hypothetical protein